MSLLFQQARAALAFLEHHRLEPSVPHYGLALAHVSGTHPALSRAIGVLIEDGIRLTADQAARLIAAHLAHALPIPPGPAPDLAAHAERLGTLADEAQGVTQAIGADVRHVVHHADDRIPGGQEVVARLTAAEQELADLKGQFEALRVAMRADVPALVDREHDRLTSALSPIGARRVLDQVGKHDRRYVILMFGIDGLVGINREFGTSVGDNVLNAIATKLRTIFPEQEAIRWSGNEFIVVVPDRTITAVRALAEEVLSLIETRRFKLLETGEWIGTVTASAAIVLAQGEELNALLDTARVKLEGAIAAGGNQVVV